MSRNQSEIESEPVTRRFSKAGSDGRVDSASTNLAGEAPPVLIVDADQRCVEANESASLLLGLERSELVGKALSSLSLPDGHLLVLPRIEDGVEPGRQMKYVAKEDGTKTRGRVPSRREREVLTLLATGSTDAKIAVQLGLSPATVQTHVRNAKGKLGARTRAQAIALAIVGGLIDVD